MHLTRRIERSICDDAKEYSDLIDLSVIPGGAFLLRDVDSETVFIPEEFSPEARLMAKTSDDFLRKEVLPLTDRIEAHDSELMHRLMQKAGDIGLLGAEIPEVYGGLGLDIRTGALIAEKLNWQQSFALTHEAHTVIATLPLMFFGNHEQKSRYLPKLASGEWIGCFCLSETGSGSDALGAQTKATLSPDGKHYLLNGTKMWITNTAFASLFTVFAKVDGQKFSVFMVERDYPGVSFGKEEHKLGMRGTSTRRVILDNVPVPVENLVGEIGKGHYAAFCALNFGRFKLEAGATGGLKETIAVCAAYAKQRKQFGRPIASFGLIQAKLGEMAARTFVLESAVYRLAGQLDEAFHGIQADADDAPKHYFRAAEEYALECGIVKVMGSELYSWATDEGIQIHGGYGYTEEFPMARAWRDQRLLRIGEGANEIVRINIVTNLLRRAEQGRLDLQRAIDAARSYTSDAQNAPATLKAAGLLLLEMAKEHYGAQLMEEQEVVAAIADILIAAYGVESALVRAEKMRARGLSDDLVNLATQAAQFYAETSLEDARRGVHTILHHLPESRNESATIRNILREERSGADLIALRRSLAAAVLEREAYPW